MALRPALRARVRRLLASLGAWGRRLRAARRRVLLAVAALVAAPFLLVGIVALFTPLPEELREPAAPSLRIHARSGGLLREVRADDGARARPLPLSSFPPHVRSAVLAAEDRRFYDHHGVDLAAVARAALSNVAHRRVVSGASTITMQLARTVRPHRRSLWGKVTEAALALRIEASLSKDRILEEYLNRVVYGPNLRGYAAASHAYLGTAPESLSLAGAALIAGLPRGPSLYAVTKRPDLAKRRRDRVLARMADAGMIDEAAKERAALEPIVARVDKPAFGAPHFTRALVSGSLAAAQPGLAEALRDKTALSEIHTTLDPELQRAAEGAVTSALDALAPKHVTAAAVVVLENATGEVLAWVGSPDFYGAAALGQNDGVLARRQPGSSLKPFVYAEAMSRFGWTGATLLPDVELHVPLPGGGDYVPHDYDRKERGPVRLREALGNSLNIPAVYTIHQLGTERVLDRLRAFGFASLVEEAEHYGPALALGDGEVTLLELAGAYATLARGGVRRPVRLVTRLVRGDHATDLDLPGVEGRALDERVAAMLTDILSDESARTAAFGDQNALELEVPVAAKTGTSKGYRDNVAVGYTREVTVAVWVGNFDGSPMRDVSGITGAGPIFRDVMEAAARSRPSTGDPLALGAGAARLGLARTPICALSGEIPTSACPRRVYEWRPAGDADHAPTCATHVRVRLDVRNGLRAGPGCASDTTTDRVFERWRAPYDAWARRTNRPLVPGGSSPACPIDEDEPTALGAADGAREGLDPRVAYPFDGARFVVDPERPVELQRLEVRVEPDDASVEVFVDDRPLGRTRSWPLAAGEHTIVARRGGRASAPVRVTVR